MGKFTDIQARRRYQVDLVEQQLLGDLNYARLNRLMPGRDGRDHWSIQLPQDWRVSIQVEERAPFTTCVLISRHPGHCPWTRSPSMKVRLYHDARMAEVVAWERHRVAKGRYDYPNDSMYHRDEKVQLNRFLGEWLNLCLAQGRAAAVNLPLTG